jgi:hypothetical protein
VKKFLAGLYILATIVAMEIAFPQPVRAGDLGNNFIAPAVTFGDGKSTFGVNGKIGITNNFSLRPYVTFPSNRTNFGTSLTYDFGSRQSNPEIAPFVGLGIAAYNSVNNTNTKATIFYQAGLDANINENIGLFGSVNIPSSRDYSTNISIGAGLRF